MEVRILIVEDEPLVAFDLEATLSDAGFSIVGVAGRSNEALALIGKNNIDVAVLDANLSGESAAPVAEALRQSGVPFVAVSGYSYDQLGSWLGDSPLLSKPYSSERLISEVTRLRQAKDA